MTELQQTIKENKAEFVWINEDGGWFFHEKEGCTKFSAAEIMGETTVEEVLTPEIKEETPVKEPIKKRIKKK